MDAASNPNPDNCWKRDSHSHVRHDSFTCVTWLIHMCDMTHSHVWHDSFTCVTWLMLWSTDSKDNCLKNRLLIEAVRPEVSGLHTMSHVTHVDESCHTCEWVMSHMWMSHVTHDNESCHTCEWVMSLTHVDESCHTCAWVMSHMTMSHVTHVNESCHTCEWVMSQMWMSHVTHVNESFHTWQWVMSHMTMSHVTHVNESCHTCGWVMSHMWMSHVTHVNESRHTCASVTSHMCMSHVMSQIPELWSTDTLNYQGFTPQNFWSSFPWKTWKQRSFVKNRTRIGAFSEKSPENRDYLWRSTLNCCRGMISLSLLHNSLPTK